MLSSWHRNFSYYTDEIDYLANLIYHYQKYTLLTMQRRLGLLNKSCINRLISNYCSCWLYLNDPILIFQYSPLTLICNYHFVKISFVYFYQRTLLGIGSKKKLSSTTSPFSIFSCMALLLSLILLNIFYNYII